jgi:hypothetical protein
MFFMTPCSVSLHTRTDRMQTLNHTLASVPALL